MNMMSNQSRLRKKKEDKEAKKVSNNVLLTNMGTQALLAENGYGVITHNALLDFYNLKGHDGSPIGNSGHIVQHIYLFMLNNCNIQNRSVTMSAKYIGGVCSRMSERTVRRHILTLESLGLITKKRTVFDKSIYKINEYAMVPEMIYSYAVLQGISNDFVKQMEIYEDITEDTVATIFQKGLFPTEENYRLAMSNMVEVPYVEFKELEIYGYNYTQCIVDFDKTRTDTETLPHDTESRTHVHESLRSGTQSPTINKVLNKVSNNESNSELSKDNSDGIVDASHPQNPSSVNSFDFPDGEEDLSPVKSKVPISKKVSTDGSNNFKHKLTQEEMKVLHIVEYWNSFPNTSTHKINEGSPMQSKTVKTACGYIVDVLRGDFYANNTIQLSGKDIDDKYLSEPISVEELEGIIQRFHDAFDNKYYPLNKSYLPKSITDFFVHYKSNVSHYLEYTLPLALAPDELDSTVEFLEENYGEMIQRYVNLVNGTRFSHDVVRLMALIYDEYHTHNGYLALAYDYPGSRYSLYVKGLGNFYELFLNYLAKRFPDGISVGHLHIRKKPWKGFIEELESTYEIMWTTYRWNLKWLYEQRMDYYIRNGKTASDFKLFYMRKDIINILKGKYGMISGFDIQEFIDHFNIKESEYKED